MREPTLAGWTPGRVPPPERLPHLRGQALAAHPRRIPEYQVEAAPRQDVPEVGLEREERGLAVAREAAGGRPQRVARGAQPPQPRTSRAV